jgi:large subunit ribosomal protein L13
MHAVAGMLPKNKLQADRLKRLRVFANEEHTHAAQNPKEIK